MKPLSFALAVFCAAVLSNAPSSAGASESPTPVTVEQAVARTLENQPAVRQADREAAAATARLRQKESGYYPSLDLEAGYTHLSPDPRIPFPGMGAVQFFPEDNYDAHLALRYTLLDFGRVASAAGTARYGAGAARRNYDLVRENLSFQTIQSFYAILLLQESIQVQEQQIRSLDETLSLTHRKRESGTATEFDVLTTRVKLEEARTRLLDLQNALRKQRVQFLRLTGEDGVVPAGELAAVPETPDEEALVAKALAGRIELQNARDAEAGAAFALKGARAEEYPLVRVGVSYGTKNGYMPELDEMKMNTVASAQVELPLFNGFRTAGRIEEARASLESSRSQVKDAEDAVAAEVRGVVSDLRTSAEKMRSAELHVRLAQEALAQAKVRYAGGVITNLDLLNAETSLDEARLLRLRAVYDYLIAREALRKAVGDPLWTGSGAS